MQSNLVYLNSWMNMMAWIKWMKCMCFAFLETLLLSCSLYHLLHALVLLVGLHFGLLMLFQSLYLYTPSHLCCSYTILRHSWAFFSPLLHPCASICLCWFMSSSLHLVSFFLGHCWPLGICRYLITYSVLQVYYLKLLQFCLNCFQF